VRISIFTEAVWPSVEAAVDFISGVRDANLDHVVRAGLNFSIVLGSACFLEGTLETVLKGLLQYRRSVFDKATVRGEELRGSMYAFYGRIEDDLSNRIGRSTGANGYDDTFRLLHGLSLHELDGVRPLWEAVTVLFQFRNVLGHGREVIAKRFSGFSVEGGEREEFPGSYRRVEEYLLKAGLLDRRFVDAHDEYLLLSDSIADHFWDMAKRVLPAIVAALSENERAACLRAVDWARNEARRSA
jgi:hypothetical protein